MRYLTASLVLAVTVLCAAPLGAQAAVTVGHSGWDWGNPTPQGNQINALEFVGSRGYAAGDFGTVLRSDDGGSSWTGIRTGITPNLNVVRTVGADTIIVGGKCTLRRSDNGGQNFSRLPWTASDQSCSADIRSFYFPDSSTGYLLLDDGNVFRTANAGQSWTRKTAVPTTKATGGQATPNDIVFTAGDTGFVVTSGGQIYRTTDGGGSWTLLTTSGAAINGIFFVDANNGFAVGDSSLVLKTVDGGATWTPKDTGFGGLGLTHIRCADALACLISDSAGDRLLRTIDGGDTWSSVSPSTKPVYAAAFASATRAVAAGQTGATVISDGGGANWSTVGGDIGGTYKRLRASSPTTAYAVGVGGVLARTTNAGESWSTLGVSTAADVRDVSFPTDAVGFALDSTGSVLKTFDSGASWQVLNTGTSVVPQAILAPDENTVLLIGPKGVRRSVDGGGHFSPVSGKAVSKASLVEVDSAGSSIFAYSGKTLIVSTNKGGSWKKVKRPPGSLNWVDFVSSKLGFALATNGRVWRTSNRGKKWSELPAIGNDVGNVLAFGSGKSGYVATDGFGDTEGGWIFHTSDGGKTWRPQLVSSAQIPVSGGLAAADATSAFALAGDNSLFRTTSGGDAGDASTLTVKPSKKKLKKRGKAKLNGKLSPASGGEDVVVSARAKGSTSWSSKTVEVAANGTFTVTFKVKKETIFVAQWAGDDDRNGDGSTVATVKVGRR